MATSENSLGAVGQYLSAVPPLLAGVNAAAVLGLGGLPVMDGVLTMGMLVAFQTLMQRFVGSGEPVDGARRRLQEAAGDMNRLDDVLRARPIPLVASGVEAPPGTAGRGSTAPLELRDVTFGYSRLEPPLIAASA